MKVELWCVGKTKEKNVGALIEYYRKRSNMLWPIRIIEWPEARAKKNKTTIDQQGEMFCKRLDARDFLILLDEKGRRFNSPQFAGYLQKKIDQPGGRLIFLIGGAYGFGQEIYDRANDMLSLSSMTFPHDLVRVVFMEQYYRALTINRNLPYHHA